MRYSRRILKGLLLIVVEVEVVDDEVPWNMPCPLTH